MFGKLIHLVQKGVAIQDTVQQNKPFNLVLLQSFPQTE